MRYYRPIIVLPLNLWNSFPIMNTFVPGFKLHLIFSQWFNYQQTSIGLDHKFGTTEATNHCLKQKLPNFPMHIWVTGPWGVIRAIICPNRYFLRPFSVRSHRYTNAWSCMFVWELHVAVSFDCGQIAVLFDRYFRISICGHISMS